jgi:dTDP-4-dehydrorhamnose reductase
MKQKKIMIIGSSGMVGKRLLDDIKIYYPNANIIGTYHRNEIKNSKKLNIENEDELEKFVVNNDPDIIIWLAGEKNLLNLEKNPLKSYLINEKPILNLIQIIKSEKIKSRLIFISSDYVFEGKYGNYKITDYAIPNTVYGKSKKLIENEILKSEINAVIIRTAAIMNKNSGFLGWLINEMENKKNIIELYDNTIFSPTATSSFNKVIARIISNESMSGIYHFAGSAMTRYEFGCIVAKILNIENNRLIPTKADLINSTFHENLSLVTSDELIDLIPTQSDLSKELLK